MALSETGQEKYSAIFQAIGNLKGKPFDTNYLMSRWGLPREVALNLLNDMGCVEPESDEHPGSRPKIWSQNPDAPNELCGYCQFADLDRIKNGGRFCSIKFTRNPIDQTKYSPTPQHIAIMTQIYTGNTSYEGIAQALGISVSTVSNHLAAIYNRIGKETNQPNPDRTGALLYFIMKGLIIESEE